jgi:hypothetical protein
MNTEFYALLSNQISKFGLVKLSAGQPFFLKTCPGLLSLKSHFRAPLQNEFDKMTSVLLGHPSWLGQSTSCLTKSS